MTKFNRILFATATGMLCATSVMAAGLTPKLNISKSATVKVEELDPYTHFADIPDGADLSSIKFRGVRKIKIATQMKSTGDVHYCKDQRFRDPGGSMYCPYTQLESPSAAYQVTYSYEGQPMASDEYGNTHFTFSVYFRPDELSPAVLDKLAKHAMTKADEADYFDVTSYRASARRIEARTHTDSKCEESIRYTTIAAQSGYITVKVDPALSRREQAASVLPLTGVHVADDAFYGVTPRPGQEEPK
ncbi:MAG: hypothetical protein JWO80_1771 [Bryobacterales bacterium]|nr:hypothetical protein [Bryobacterales bacterium]